MLLPCIKRGIFASALRLPKTALFGFGSIESLDFGSVEIGQEALEKFLLRNPKRLKRLSLYGDGQFRSYLQMPTIRSMAACERLDHVEFELVSVLEYTFTNLVRQCMDAGIPIRHISFDYPVSDQMVDELRDMGVIVKHPRYVPALLPSLPLTTQPIPEGEDVLIIHAWLLTDPETVSDSCARCFLVAFWSVLPSMFLRPCPFSVSLLPKL